MKTRRRQLWIFLVGVMIVACVWFAYKAAAVRADMMLALEIQKLNGTPSGIDELRSALPNCKIQYEKPARE